jgi:hypothetical protein
VTSRAALAALVLVLALAGARLAGAGPAPAASWGARVGVPGATGAYDLLRGYRRLHAAGLRVTIDQAFSLASLCLPSAHTQSPPAGTSVARRSTVTLSHLSCMVGSPAANATQAVVPGLVGQRASRAVAWAERAGIYWQVARLPALRSGALAELLDNYVVTDQSPAAGQTLGRGTDCSTYTTKCYRVTPLVLHVRRARG